MRAIKTIARAGVHSAAKQAAAARAWVTFLKTPETAEHFKKYGLEPG